MYPLYIRSRMRAASHLELPMRTALVTVLFCILLPASALAEKAPIVARRFIFK